LRSVGCEPALAPVLDALKDKDVATRRQAALAVSNMRPVPKTAMAPLVEALRDPDSMVRTYVGVTLQRIGEPAVPLLLAALTDKDPQVRRGAITGLGTNRNAEVVAALMEALKDEDNLVGISAATKLGQIGQPALKPLIEALKDQQPRVRHRAAIALGLMGPRAKAAVPLLIELLKDDDFSVKTSAGIALKQIDPAAAKREGVLHCP
jgi:HEAT repeat protein